MKAPKEFSYIFENLENLCNVLYIKAKLGVAIRKAYQEGQLEKLEQIKTKQIPALIRRLQKFEKGFYKQWMYENKDNGYQTHDLRIGGMIKRLQTVKNILTAYLNGEITIIYELEDKLLSFNEDATLDMLLWKDWKYIHSVYVG